MKTYEKIIIGAVGGLAAVTVKFLGQDYDFLVQNISGISDTKKQSLIFGYAVLTPILMFLGALCAWASDEVKKIKLLAIAIAAPAMVTTWSGGNKIDSPNASLSFIFSTAYAQTTAEEIESNTGYKVIDESELDAKSSTSQKIKEGIGLFFGYGKSPEYYWVVVGSFKDKDQAKQYVDEINAEDESLGAFVGIRILPNEYYPVIVGSLFNLDDAKKLMERALLTNTVNDAFLSNTRASK